ncbi:unnamed protein product, partial [marine sediment metagenome]
FPFVVYGVQKEIYRNIIKKRFIHHDKKRNVVKIMTKTTGANAIAKTLKKFDTEYIFYIFGYGVPSREMEAEGIKMVLTRNEKCAAYIADGYARIGLRPGVAWGYRGPGSMNLAAGLADGYWSSSPIIALTSATQKSHIHKDSHYIDDYMNNIYCLVHIRLIFCVFHFFSRYVLYLGLYYSI